jgi:hypothetical protein
VIRRLSAALLVAVTVVSTVSACTSSTSGTPPTRRIIPAGTSPQSSGPAAPSGSVQPDPNDAYRRPESPAAKAIDGVRFHLEPDHNHVPGSISYDTTPPTGGNHSQLWADCTGTVYAQPIANENAVHMLEHGAVWITYNATTLPADQLATLQQLVTGADRLALSPYPGLKANVSLQAWGYQLFVDDAHDPRITRFIDALRYNPQTTPEYGATCSMPAFKQHPSTFGHPLWLPAG